MRITAFMLGIKAYLLNLPIFGVGFIYFNGHSVIISGSYLIGTYTSGLVRLAFE